MKHNIDYEALLANVTNMIGLLEYDAMRSPGKAKMNYQPSFLAFLAIGCLLYASPSPRDRQKSRMPSCA